MWVGFHVRAISLGNRGTGGEAGSNSKHREEARKKAAIMAIDKASTRSSGPTA